MLRTVKSKQGKLICLSIFFFFQFTTNKQIFSIKQIDNKIVKIQNTDYKR